MKYKIGFWPELRGNSFLFGTGVVCVEEVF